MASSGSYKYLYERLGDKRFQQLCGALVVDRFEDVAVFPVGEKDGGRDMTSGTGAKRTILQVKWTGARSKKPASWLTSTINGEDSNIRRLVSEGCQKYILITNVEGSATPKSGTRDEIERTLDELGKKYGIPMSCIWASDLDAWVDLAPFEIKAAYVDMLAGTDALITLLRSELLQDRERRERDVLVTYVATQWDRDKRVKFKQVDFASDLLTDFFVDVAGRRNRNPRNMHLPSMSVGAVARHLLAPETPWLTLLEGVPGQGKSTVAQYVCQVYRAEFIGREHLAARKESLPADQTNDLRVAIRIDLADYAEWIGGNDPYAAVDQAGRKAKPRSRIDLEWFLVDHFEAAAPGHSMTIEDIRSILNRFPTQIVLDGLDEVASLVLRENVVRHIDEFTSRWVQARPGNMRILVTTRPNASGLPEPAQDIFERIVLQPLDESIKKRYVRRWAAAQHLDSAERRTLERVFGEQTAAPHVSQLADNPMQLTILLHLIRTKGESLPTARTSLYRSYIDLFLERESLKSKTVLESRADLEEATSYLGWLMQALSEVDASSTRLPAQRIIREMTAYLAVVEKASAPVKVLFEAMRDRVWVLTSKQTGTYEFDVQSIREFFTARFLYEFAQADTGHDYEPAGALIELLPRAYWANTARFLGGHFQPREIPNVADLIEERFSELPGGRQFQTTVWTLLCDGIFKERAASQRRIVNLFADDLGVRLIASEIASGSKFAILAKEYGGLDLGERLRTAITADVSSPLTSPRSEIAAAVGDRATFKSWWAAEVENAAGSSREADWLHVGRVLQPGLSLAPTTVDALALDTPGAARSALAAGIAPYEGGSGAKRLLDWVLDGHCSETSPSGTSEAADLLRVVAPHTLITMAGGNTASNRLVEVGHEVPETSQSQRTAALKRLAERHGDGQLQAALRVRKGEKGTTSRWVNTARALSAAYGRPTWLATEIAAVAAALPKSEVRIGGNFTRDAACFGPAMDYGTWLPGISMNHGKDAWWQEQRVCCSDDHSKAAWVLGLLVAGSPAVIGKLLPEIAEIVSALPETNLQALVSSSSRIAGSKISRRRPLEITVDWAEDTAVRLLLAHNSADPNAVMGTDRTLIAAAASFPVGAWPAEIVATRMALEDPSLENLELVESFGPAGLGIFPVVENLPTDAAEYILRSPSLFPNDWLDMADTSLSKGHNDRPLKTHADVSWGF
ncbi:NACHT domain-containing protein [Arthrobacter sp. TB 26]|uniref:NACHT domain-containing protein n=1 Tax=Arthrobacter sp. TB 26 TaxID=494420 RepID=UPI0003F6A1D7|nr:hypothetical protein [Arthrobacter sp. TB 26]